MKKTIVNFTVFFAAFIVFFACLSDARADRLSDAEKAQYATANTSFDTFQICDSFNDSDKLYRIFNQYFASELQNLGKDSYTSGNQLFADRGVHEFVDSWHLNPGAEISGTFRGAANEHTLNLLNANKESVWSQVYPKNTYNSMNEAFMDTYYQVGTEGDYNITLSTMRYYGDSLPIGGYTLNGDAANTGTLNGVTYDMINMIAIDVTDLMRIKTGNFDLESAFMFAWEDYLIGGMNGLFQDIDFDYNDIVYIMTNVAPSTSVVPEPASMLIFGLALAGLPFAKRLRKNKNAV
jgi:hypothetical protein